MRLRTTGITDRAGRILLAGLLASLLAGLLAGPLSGPLAAGAAVLVPAASAGQPATPQCADATPDALAGFFDDGMPDRLRQVRVPGAAVSVVSGGEMVFAAGYGTADVERGVPFDASRSLVRIASITKLFTWTAVMQQVEAGRLDLNADVNRYLTDFQIPATYPEPVTLQHLMDHTAGFEDRVIGTQARSAGDVPPLGEYLADHLPARIRPPGEISAYSNYGAALAGHIVAEVSGEPYDAYLQRHLFTPLGMARSTAAEPVPATLAADLAGSYDSDSDPPRRIPFVFDPMPPDGSVSATATDLAHFMIAHLDQGRFGDERILAPATVARMHQRSFTADPRLDGSAHGFRERTINGHRALTHDGGWEGFRSLLVLVPDCDLGLFLSMNGTGGGSTTMVDFVDGFYDRFTPGRPAGPDPTRPAAVGPVEAAAPRAGFYQPTRHNESTVEKVATLLGPSRLAVRADGTIRFRGTDWLPRGEGLYETADGTDRLVFLTGTDGRRYAATNGSAYELIGRDETLPANLVVLAGFTLLALTALALPVAALVRRVRGRPAARSRTWRAARWLAAASAWLGVGFLVGLAATLFGSTEEFLYRVPVSFRLLLAAPILVLAGTAAAVAGTVGGWRGSGAGAVARLHQVGLLAGLAALAWFLWHWNLLGWQYA